MKTDKELYAIIAETAELKRKLSELSVYEFREATEGDRDSNGF